MSEHAFGIETDRSGTPWPVPCRITRLEDGQYTLVSRDKSFPLPDPTGPVDAIYYAYALDESRKALLKASLPALPEGAVWEFPDHFPADYYEAADISVSVPKKFRIGVNVHFDEEQTDGINFATYEDSYYIDLNDECGWYQYMDMPGGKMSPLTAIVHLAELAHELVRITAEESNARDDAFEAAEAAAKAAKDAARNA